MEPLEHISDSGVNSEQTTGRDGKPKSIQVFIASNWIQRTPAGLPWGIPGIGDDISGAMQQAPQPAIQLWIISSAIT
jgi:hypothetical protein